MMGMAMQAPRRCLDGKIGSCPAKDTEPPAAGQLNPTLESRSSSAATGSKSLVEAVGAEVLGCCELMMATSVMCSWKPVRGWEEASNHLIDSTGSRRARAPASPGRVRLADR